MLPSPTPRPNVRGQLSVTSVPELLVLALDRKLHGSIVIKTPASTKSAFYLDAGQVTKVRTAEPIEPLGRLLMASGAIDRATLDAALYLAAEHKDRLGSSLMQLRAVPPALLEATLAEQLARRVAWLGSLPSTSIFGYYSGIDFLEERPACAADPLALIWRAVRDGAADSPRQESLLTALEQRPLRLHAEATPERFDLSPEELALVALLRAKPQMLASLIESSGLDVIRARRLVYALALTRHLDLGRDRRPVESVPPKALSTPPKALSTPPKAPSVPPRALGTPPKAPSVPPRAPSSQRPSSARETPRSSPAEARRRPSSTEPVRSEEAERAYQAAKLCVNRKQFERAETFSRQACEADPHNPEHLALHAWLRMQRGELAHPLRATEIVAQLDRAVMKERASVSIRFYRAQVLKRLGRHDEAYRDFRFVARHQPDHLDAVREVRLHEMRSRNLQKKPSVFSKLFLR